MNSLLIKNELINAVSGRALSEAECIFTNVTTDSRNVKEFSLFVPLVGEFQNGHKYVPQAIEKGASVILVNNNEIENNPDLYKKLAEENTGVLIIGVENTLHALQDAAEAYVAKFPELIKVSITGSCGKTTTKELMVSVAKQHFGEDFVVYTKGNFNSETGLPLSVFEIRENHKIGIFEMGMNRVEEIGEISKVLKSKYGIITNIGTAHIGILGSRENIALEKRKSFRYIPKDGAVFVSAEDDFAGFCAEGVAGKIIKFGKSVAQEKNDVEFIKDRGLIGTSFKYKGVEILLPISGEYNYQNALGVIACAAELGITAEEIKAGLENVASVSGRMEVKNVILKSGVKITLINDCYNANFDSMSKVIQLVGQLDDVKQKFVVLGDMKELGKESEKAHSGIGKILKGLDFTKIYITGPEMAACKNILSDGDICTFKYYEDNSADVFEEIASDILKLCKEDAVILLKGSHSMNLDAVIPLIIENGGKC